MKFTLRSALGAAFVLSMAISVAHADCTYPQAPAALPDGKSASKDEMIAAMTSFKKYDADVNAYSACLDQEMKAKQQEGGSAAMLMQLKAMQAKKQNAAVAELEEKTAKFNEQVRAFKARG